MFELLPILIIIFAVVGVQWWWQSKQLDSAVREWCRVRGFVYLRHRIEQRPNRRGMLQSGRIYIEFKDESTGEVEGGSADWIPGTLSHQIVFDRFVLPAAVNQVLREEDEDQMQPNPQEAKVSVEVARRLDSITQTPGWIEEHDLDGSGHIDSVEWDILRERVIGEVRAELEVSEAERNRSKVQTPDEDRDEGWW